MKRFPWNPYFVGAGIGVLSWIVFVVVNAPLGISTAISEISGAAAMPIVGREAVAANTYWAKTAPQWDYGVLFLIGTFLGALVSSLLSGRFKVTFIPEVWQERFGRASFGRVLTALAGGFIIMFGARLAGGCTSGHGISGSLQLAVSSWVFFIVMFVTGIITARVIFAGRR